MLRLEIHIPEDFVFCGSNPADALYFAHRTYDIVIAVHRSAKLPVPGGPVGRYAVLSFAGAGDNVVPVREEMDEWADVLAQVASLTATASKGGRFRRVERAG